MMGEEDDVTVRLWDELADFDAARTDEACRRLMVGLAERVNATNIGWVSTLRTADDPNDLLRGWRIGTTAYFKDEPLNTAAIAEMKARWMRREVDPLTARSIEGAGQRFRVFSLRQAMPSDWFDKPYYKMFYEPRRVHDCIIAVSPINQDTESTFVLHAAPERGPFDAADIAWVARTLRGLKWFHRRLMLSHGLAVASTPLTPAERRTLTELLTGATEKKIAERLELAASTVHQYAKSIYRKYGVKGRSGLMSLWLNRMS